MYSSKSKSDGFTFIKTKKRFDVNLCLYLIENREKP